MFHTCGGLSKPAAGEPSQVEVTEHLRIEVRARARVLHLEADEFVLDEHPRKMSFAEHEYGVEAFAPDPARTGRSWRGQGLVLPEDGVAFSSQATVELPGPGGWELAWSGEGCSNDPRYRTSTEVCGGDTYEWTISVEAASAKAADSRPHGAKFSCGSLAIDRHSNEYVAIVRRRGRHARILRP